MPEIWPFDQKSTRSPAMAPSAQCVLVRTSWPQIRLKRICAGAMADSLPRPAHYVQFLARPSRQKGSFRSFFGGKSQKGAFFQPWNWPASVKMSQKRSHFPKNDPFRAIFFGGRPIPDPGKYPNFGQNDPKIESFPGPEIGLPQKNESKNESNP